MSADNEKEGLRPPRHVMPSRSTPRDAETRRAKTA
jgi:hypothetical protein